MSSTSGNSGISLFGHFPWIRWLAKRVHWIPNLSWPFYKAMQTNPPSMVGDVFVQLQQQIFVFPKEFSTCPKDLMSPRWHGRSWLFSLWLRPPSLPATSSLTGRASAPSQAWRNRELCIAVARPPSELGRFSEENTQIDKSPSEPLILSPLPSIQWICSVHIPEGVFARIGICFPLNSTINHICGGEFDQKAEWLRQANSLLRGQGGRGGLQEIPRRWVSKLQGGEHTGWQFGISRCGLHPEGFYIQNTKQI